MQGSMRAKDLEELTIMVRAYESIKSGRFRVRKQALALIVPAREAWK